jgi:hypothetical protein
MTAISPSTIWCANKIQLLISLVRGEVNEIGKGIASVYEVVWLAEAVEVVPFRGDAELVVDTAFADQRSGNFDRRGSFGAAWVV